MHNSYFVLKKVSARLQAHLLGGTVTSCFSQESDVLVVGFHNKRRAFFIQADVGSGFCCLSFPDQFHRARRNSIDLFPEVIGKTVRSVTQYRNERSFSVDIAGDLSLLFKMHGNKANVILMGQGRPSALFKNSLKADWNINTASLDRNVDWSHEAFLKSREPVRYYAPLPSVFWGYIKSKGWDSFTPEERWKLFHHSVNQLESGEYSLIHEPFRQPVFTLLRVDAAQPLSSDVLEALTHFYRISHAFQTSEAERKASLTHIDQRLRSLRRVAGQAKLRFSELARDNHYSRWADIIMANLHNIRKGSTEVRVVDFNGKPVSIPLDPALDPQRNAERYYRKSKNRVREKGRIEETARERELEIARLTLLRNQLATAQTTGELEQVISGIEKPRKAAEQKSRPYHEHLYKKYKIWVGRNAAANDSLTLKFASPNDEWLHARDCAGSHVVIKGQSGKTTPKDVIERAAELAGWNSKRKNETLCPVIVTKKKYVRKRKGSPPGEIVVERERVIFVTPRG